MMNPNAPQYDEVSSGLDFKAQNQQEGTEVFSGSDQNVPQFHALVSQRNNRVEQYFLSSKTIIAITTGSREHQYWG